VPRRRIKGDRAFIKLIKQMPEAVQSEVETLLRESGAEILTEQRSRVRRKTGALSQGLSMKVLPKSRRLQVGIIGKPLNRKLFYGRIIEFGRKGQTVRARKAGGKPYLMKIRGMAPSPFIYSVNRESIYSRFRSLWDRVLKKVSTGVSDD
jgi:hypothetical protein